MICYTFMNLHFWFFSRILFFYEYLEQGFCQKKLEIECTLGFDGQVIAKNSKK